MSDQLIHSRFAAVVDMLDDLPDAEKRAELRARTRELEADYVDAFNEVVANE